MRMIFVSAVLALAVPCAHSAGFRLTEQDAAANGMGNSFVAVANNASAVWYNPAAMTELDGTRLALGTVMVYPAMKHEFATGSDDIAKKLHIPPYVYITRKMGEKWAIGLSFNAPFGLATEWDKTTAVTRYVATLSDIKAVNYNINAATKLGDKLSFALGLDYVALDAKLYQKVSPLAPTRELQLSGDGAGVGYNLAFFYRANEKWTLGASYRSPVKIDVDGTALVTNAGGLSNTASTRITLPDTLQLGAAYRPSERWLLSATGDYTDWTTYHALKVRSNTMSALGLPNPYTTSKNWKSVWAFRLGTEYSYSEDLKLRAGTFYDYNAVTEKYYETRVPDSDRLAFSLGAGYNVTKNLTFDLSYTYLKFAERTIHDSVQDNGVIATAINGKYKSSAHLPAINLGYKF